MNNKDVNKKKKKNEELEKNKRNRNLNVEFDQEICLDDDCQERREDNVEFADEENRKDERRREKVRMP